jgi:transcriptional regulator with XRE-family HTH domain
VKKGMSVAQLAEKAGVSIPAIYFIESGQSANPRRETVEKLRSVLGAKAPAEISDTIREQSTIEGLGMLTDFDPHDEPDNLPTGAGVYVFYDISQRPIYIGMSDNVRNRILSHREKYWFRAPIVETGSYVEIKDKVLRRQTEELLIRFLKSNAVLNKQNVDRE